ncbi:MAG: glycosyltransferase [Treponema sp.]|nr:glycosyltransferase [Treponema sp.]
MIFFSLAYYAIFVGLHLALLLGVFLERKREISALKEEAGSQWPFVSVVIPVHNESKRIGALLNSIEKQNYQNAEYIFIDDRSKDNTPELLAAFADKIDKGDNRTSIKILSLTENPGPNHKQFALAFGIDEAKGEFLLFTDADCELPPLWIRGMVRRMSNAKTGVMIAPVLKRPLVEGIFKKKSFFSLYQCYEHGIRYVYLAGAAGLGAAGGGFGNNIIIRRATLDTIGGYRKVPPSPTEDAALVSLVRSSTDFKVRAALGSDVHIITESEDFWRLFIKQTLRWNNGGLFSPDPTTRLNYNFLMITITMGVLALPLLPFLPSILLLPLGPLTVMILNSISNFGFLYPSLPKRKLGYVLPLLFTPVYFTFMTILGYLGIKPEWKGKKV